MLPFYWGLNRRRWPLKFQLLNLFFVELFLTQSSSETLRGRVASLVVNSNSRHTGSIETGSEGAWATAPGSTAAHLPCARKYTIVCVFAHICVLFFAELFLTANLGSERSTCRKKTHTNLFLLCMNWWKPHSIFGGCNDFLENNSRFGYSWFFFDVLIILDIKYSWRGSQVGCEENFNFSWQRKAPTLL